MHLPDAVAGAFDGIGSVHRLVIAVAHVVADSSGISFRRVGGRAQARESKQKSTLSHEPHCSGQAMIALREMVARGMEASWSFATHLPGGNRAGGSAVQTLT